MRQCFKESSKGPYSDLFCLKNEKLGRIMCWMHKERACYSDCAAFDGSNDNIRCSALPDATIIAQIVEKHQGQ